MTRIDQISRNVLFPFEIANFIDIKSRAVAHTFPESRLFLDGNND
jgi:hypothetical protein